VTAIDSVELLVFDRDGLQNMIARNTKIALSIIDKLCRRLQDAHLKIQHLVKRDAEGLIALHLSSLYRELPRGETIVPYQKCLEEISFSLELPMEEVQKTLDDMGHAGILEKTGDALRLVDGEKLRSSPRQWGRSRQAQPEPAVPPVAPVDSFLHDVSRSASARLLLAKASSAGSSSRQTMRPRQRRQPQRYGLAEGFRIGNTG